MSGELLSGEAAQELLGVEASQATVLAGPQPLPGRDELTHEGALFRVLPVP